MIGDGIGVGVGAGTHSHWGAVWSSALRLGGSSALRLGGKAGQGLGEMDVDVVWDSSSSNTRQSQSQHHVMSLLGDTKDEVDNGLRNDPSMGCLPSWVGNTSSVGDEGFW